MVCQRRYFSSASIFFMVRLQPFFSSMGFATSNFAYLKLLHSQSKKKKMFQKEVGPHISPSPCFDPEPYIVIHHPKALCPWCPSDVSHFSVPKSPKLVQSLSSPYTLQQTSPFPMQPLMFLHIKTITYLPDREVIQQKFMESLHWEKNKMCYRKDNV